MGRNIFLGIFTCMITGIIVLTSDHLIVKQQNVFYEFAIIVVIFSLLSAIERALFIEARSIVGQYHKQDSTGIVAKRILKTGILLNVVGVIVIFIWLIEQIFYIQMMTLKCSVVIMFVGIILYSVGTVIILSLSLQYLKSEAQ